MAYKDILVHVDNSESSPARLNASMRLAKAWDAKMTGLYVLSKPFLPAYAEAQISADIIEAQAKEMEKIAARAEESFSAATRSNDLKAEWRVVENGTADALALHSRFYDLVVVGQHNPDEDFFISDHEMPDRMILTSGRPAMIIPYVGEYETIGENVMIAWDGSSQASRAVHDALAILTDAKEVTVMVINPKKTGNGSGKEPGAGVVRHLAEHGIKTVAEHVTTDMDPGNMLLSRAADKGIDLIVMGAYGHARWTEFVLGGVTKHMLAHMTVPVLMSH
ncbi:MAG: universal stress protein [Proteobacteria bacterium]|nr:universal stress protein [Pseudomonadota bacterium]